MGDGAAQCGLRLLLGFELSRVGALRSKAGREAEACPFVRRLAIDHEHRRLWGVAAVPERMQGVVQLQVRQRLGIVVVDLAAIAGELGLAIPVAMLRQVRLILVPLA